ncbi:nucleoside hydrolase [Kitasatospora aureofaciens]|uniref:nucleoside hydrolase n=1 Tax=Kitasatospora aureofaciens TaxID=1894 RepID=UPI001C479EB3|nr:nucleoside hydrolase [Kitasatospora aureofaciens]MBV6699720.1 nucleoside hydrolase [Kitasatospora aureofaciens]
MAIPIVGRLGVGVPVGAYEPGTDVKPVSGFHRRWLGKVPAREPDAEAWQLLRDALAGGDVTLLTGAPLKNPGMLLEREPDVRIARWVAQGGFAGDSVVPPEHRLPTFEGRETCPTFNFNGAPDAASKLLESPHVGERVLVSKNVCHGVVYDGAMPPPPCRRGGSPGMALVRDGTGVYLARRRAGKAFHAPLAAAVALDESVCALREVEVYRERGAWGARPASGTRTRISVSVSVDHARFLDVLTTTE